MNYLIIGLAGLTFLSTLAGGTIAIKKRALLPFFFAFSSGALLSVAFFDMLPESVELGQAAGLSTRLLFTALVGSFIFYYLLERFFLTHHFHEPETHGHLMGPVGASSLVLHSFLDGIAIGAAFQVNAAVGLIVALAVISHDFTDGINTVTVMLRNRHHEKNARLFLLLDALAPVAGVVLSSVWHVSPAVLSVVLAVFAGEFLYLGATSLLPETHHHPGWKTAASMLAGALLIYGLTAVL